MSLHFLSLFGSNRSSCDYRPLSGVIEKPYENACDFISVDINGKKKPKYGEITNPNRTVGYCLNKNGRGQNCAACVIHKGNMDYLRKNISW